MNILLVTGPPGKMELPIEVTVEILLNLPYRDLLSYCSTHRQASEICRDDYFWKLKADHDYYGLSEYKPPTLSYRQQYRELMNLSDPNDAVTFGRLDYLILLDRKGLQPNQVGVNLAAWKGYLHLLDWMKKRGYCTPDINGANWAVIGGHDNILDWMEQNGCPLPDAYAADYAARDGFLSLLEWMDQRGYSPPTENGADLAVRYGHLNVLKWMDQKGYPHPTQRGANSAAENGDLEIIQWLESKGYPLPDKNGIAWATENNRQNVLDWYHSKRMFE